MTRTIMIGLPVLVCVAGFVAGFACVSTVFGVSSAVVLSLLFAPTLAVSMRLFFRWPDVRGRELLFLAVLFSVTVGGAVFVVCDWYSTGMDRLHTEDLKWASFERLLRLDPAFQDVKVNLTDAKHIYWASGTVASDAELDRLKFLASHCGIEGGRIDGPYQDSVSLTVRASAAK
jgi:hypothetical protein